MKFRPTVQVGGDEIAAIEAGSLVMQPGQWIQIDWCDRKSRWVGLSPAGILLAVHHPVSLSQFKGLCRVNRRSRDMRAEMAWGRMGK